MSVLLKEVKPFADYEMRIMVASIVSKIKLLVTLHVSNSCIYWAEELI